MRKALLLFVAIATIALSLGAEDGLGLINAPRGQNESSQLYARGSSFPCWGYAIGRCNVRSGASTKSSIVYEIYNNEEVQVQSKSGSFYYIYSSRCGWGWTHVTNLRLGSRINTGSRSSSYPCWGYAIGRCNVRYGASTGYGVAFEIYNNDAVEVHGRSGDFYRIYSSRGGWGWTHVTNLRLGSRIR